MPEPKKILFILPYPLGKAPSQRFRVEAFFPLLKANGFRFETHTFFDEKAWNLLYQKGSYFQKGLAVIKGFIHRAAVVVTRARKSDFIFIHREASPLGPPVFEWMLAKILRKKIIYDFDDAIWIPNTSKENRIAGWLKAFWKIKPICKWASVVVGGNEFLCNYARLVNTSVVKIPTCVDTVNRHNQLKQPGEPPVTIGWTGSHSTLHYLDELVPTLSKLADEVDFRFLVISNKPPEFNLKNLVFIPWAEKTEVEDLLQIDIGLMPLKQDAWSEGKCGFKLIQYLALGIPAVASPIGVNKEIVTQGVSGFLCDSEAEWYDALLRLYTDQELRLKMGEEGRKTIIEQYSIQSQSPKFLALFN